LCVLPGSAHNSVYSAPGALAAAVEEFLDRVL
jgi:hypothetical protein